jgi:beta-phosphoglucomutase-like phosphatase (HAD superfamily)
MTTWLRGEALLCDLDGTLVDSSASVARAWTRWAERRQGQLVASYAELIEHQRGRVAEDTIRAFAPSLSEDEVAADAAAHLVGQAQDTDDTVAFRGVATVLNELTGFGARWAVVTSADSRLARARLSAAGLPQPPALVTADDVDRPKPAPEGFLAAARALGADPTRSLVVEDASVGVAAGLASGGRVLLVGDDTAGTTSEGVMAFRWADVVDIRGGPDDVVLHLR